MDSNLVYRIHDNKYGETYISKRKYQGDPNIYECDEVWYEIYLQNGKHGFIWAGYNGMYVKEQYNIKKTSCWNTKSQMKNYLATN